jgi:putative thiamine transport system permease protein
VIQPLRALPPLTLAFLALPVAAGLAGTLVPAFAPGALAALADWLGLWPALRLSVTTGLAATLLSLALTLLLVAVLRGTPAFAVLRRLLSPLLAVPHAAAALGLAFLIAPSGWIARALSPWATGWTVPPDALILNDPGGLALILGLVAKEVPFLLLMALATLPQTGADARVRQAETLGYGRLAAFVLTTGPALYAGLRLPVYAVLAYGMTTVDMGMILGPSRPPTLSVQIALWMAEGDLAERPRAAAAALVQCLAVLGALALWRGAETGAGRLLRHLAASGHRFAGLDGPARAVARTAGAAMALAILAGLAGLALWSLAGPWDFPDALPDRLTLATWDRAAPMLLPTAGATIALAGLAAAAALVLVLGCLEAEHRFGLRPGPAASGILWAPLIVPQVAFLPGLQVAAAGSNLPPALAVWAGHLVFVLPYVYLSLAPVWRSMDPRIARAGAALGVSDLAVLARLRLPLLLAPILTAGALGIAVSVGQYLPTLLLGGGRIETATTEAVALSSGGNRRLIGTHALIQMAIPAAAFALALAVPALVWRNRRGMRA